MNIEDAERALGVSRVAFRELRVCNGLLIRDRSSRSMTWVVVINPGQSLYEQQRTLVHEVVHIYRGISYKDKVCDWTDHIAVRKYLDEDASVEKEMEQFCKSHPEFVEKAFRRYRWPQPYRVYCPSYLDRNLNFQDVLF